MKVIKLVLHHFGILACVLVALSFLLFAIEKTGEASKGQLNKLDSGQQQTPTPVTSEAERERRHSDVREWIDDANDVLVAPFEKVVGHPKSEWVRRGVPSLLALLFYGFVVTLLANSLPGSRTRGSEGI